MKLNFSVDGRKDPRIDISIGSEQALIAFMEVGLVKIQKDEKGPTRSNRIHKMWWKKVGQALKNLKLIFENGCINKNVEGSKEKPKFKADGPILFTVIVVDAKETETRLGIFSAEPRGKKGDFRVSVICRTQGTTETVDKVYGAFIYAVKYFVDHKNDLTKTGDDGWIYLGPDCTKITTSSQGDMVLRAYDNRVRSTPRSPVLYDNYDPLNDKKVDVLTVTDVGTKDPLEFGKIYKKNGEKLCSMLFHDKNTTVKSQVRVIAVPFEKGGHLCRDFDQAHMISQTLKDLHENGFVHGDIRGTNLIFSNSGCRLIDFDFGGKAGEAIYPPHYNPEPTEGLRVGCHSGKKITIEDDFLALRYVLTLNTYRIRDRNQNLSDIDLGVCEDMESLLSCLEDAKEKFPRARFEPEEKFEGFVKKAQRITHEEDEAIDPSKQTSFRTTAEGPVTKKSRHLSTNQPRTRNTRLPKETPAGA